MENTSDDATTTGKIKTSSDDASSELGIKVLAVPWGKDVDFSVQSILLSAMHHLDEQFQHAMTFQYDPSSGYLFDETTNFYYIPQHNLFYNSVNATYYSFMNGEYHYHSTILSESEQQPQLPKGDVEKISSAKDEARRKGVEGTQFMCLMVKDSNVLEVGHGLPISIAGVILGRQDADDVISIPEKKLSRRHCYISYRPDLNPAWPFAITDMGSTNGTFLNDERLSKSGKESDPSFLMHGDKIKLSETLVEAHIHEGSGYCSECRHVWKAYFDASENVLEDGNAEKSMYEKPNLHKYVPGESMVSKTKEANKANKDLKQRIWKENSDIKAHSPSTQYIDRAEERRKTKGSHYDVDDGRIIVPESASTEKEIPIENKGRKLLQKIGWTGKGLGKHEQGIVAPINVAKRAKRQGLG